MSVTSTASKKQQGFVSLRGERAFARLRRGKRGHHKLLTVSWLPYKQLRHKHVQPRAGAHQAQRETPPQSRVGFVVSKKVGNAVVRNRVRRRLREGLQALWLEHKLGSHPIDMIIIAKPASAEADYWQLKAALAYALYKSQLTRRY